MFETSKVDRARLQNTAKRTGHSLQSTNHSTFWTVPLPLILGAVGDSLRSTWCHEFVGGSRSNQAALESLEVDTEATKTATVPFQLTQTTQVTDLNRYDPIWSVTCTCIYIYICYKLSATKVMVLLVLVFHATCWKVIWFVHQTVKNIH